MTDRR